MGQESFQDILNEKLREKSTPSPRTTLADLEPAGLAFLLGQIGKFEIGARANPYPRPRPRPRPDHKFSDLQKISFDYFASTAFPLAANFSAEQLKKSFRHLALKLHPDLGGNASQFIELKKHVEILKTVF